MQPRQTLLSAASRVGEASDRVLYTIGEEDVTDRERKDLVLGLAKTVANSTAALVLKAKNVASGCDSYNQTEVSYIISRQNTPKFKLMISQILKKIFQNDNLALNYLVFGSDMLKNI